jgi:hypothetical protein
VSEEPETKLSSSSSGKFHEKKPKKELKKSKKSSSTSTSSSSAAKETIREIPSPPSEPTISSPSCHVVETTTKPSKSPECVSPTDMSDSSSDSEIEKKMDFVSIDCNSMHEGRQLVHTILPINIENLFGLLFHKSKFFTEFHKMRKTTDLIQGEWEDQPDGTKKRVISLNVAITQVVGPKSSHVTETQIMRNCSSPGMLYSIDATSVNAGIIFFDFFLFLCVLTLSFL